MTNAELQTQVDRLTSILAERDRKAAEDKAAAIAAQEATDATKSAAERAQAAAAEREKIRRGAWVNHFLGQAKPDEPVGYEAIQAAVPKDEGQWPPGVDPASFVLTVGARIRPEEKTDMASTTLGRMLAALTPKLN